MRYLALILLIPLCAQDRAWVTESNKNAQVLLDAQAKLSPEGAGAQGTAGLDNEIRDISPGYVDRARKILTAAKAALEQRRAAATHPLVKQDLEIMIDSATRSLEGITLAEKYSIPYINVAGAVFGGIRGLLDPQVAAERRPAALIRLRKYTGMEPGFEPYARLAEKRTREKLNQTGLSGPARGELERDLANTQTLL